MLEIASALLHDAAVLFLEKPTKGLDIIAGREVICAIAQHSQNDKTILLTTHLLEEADELCRRVAFIVDGCLVANDTPRNLKLSHGKRHLEATIDEDDQTRQLYQPVVSMDDVKDQDFLANLIAQGVVCSIHSQEATIEEVFIEIGGLRPALFSKEVPRASTGNLS
ncbi:MAG TPA: hypothetical protein VF831_11130 [Anaerolineales bacterium]